MHRRLAQTALAGLLPLLAAAVCCGCASIGPAQLTPKAELPHLNPGHNQILAWVPVELAQTGTVAQAVAHIALAQAKKATEADLCGGTWMFSGQLRQNGDPALAQAPQALGGFSGWHVRISWDPRLAECGVTAQSYSLALSRHLPAWMMTQSGQPLALFHQGIALYHQDDAPAYAVAMIDSD